MTGPKEVTETGLKHLRTHHLRHIAHSGRLGTPVLEEGSRHLWFCDTFLRGKKLMFTLWLLISKTALLEIKYSNKYWKRAVGIYFLRLPLGEISLRSLNSPKDFWFPKRPCSSSASFPERGRSPWAPPKGSETGLKPFWNTFRLTISDSVLVRLQHHCFILLFISRKDVFFLYVWAPPKGLKPVWNCR